MQYRTGLVSLYTQDVARLKAFYADTLGIPVVDQLSGPAFVFLAPASGTPIAIRDARELPEGTPTDPGSTEIGLMVDDVDAAYNDWKARGLPVRSEIVDMGAGRMFAAQDPDGHRLSVYTLYQGVRDIQQEHGVELG